MNLILKAENYREGRWRNGLGVSWDIAQEGSEEFTWRMALARLDADVPFSSYPGVDRVFTIFEGEGVELDIDVIGKVEAKRFRPTHFPGDRQTNCRLLAGPCRALNLFVKRSTYRPEVSVTCHGKGDELTLEKSSLLFNIDGLATIDGEDLEREDSAVISSTAFLHCIVDTILWRATLAAANTT